MEYVVDAGKITKVEAKSELDAALGAFTLLGGRARFPMQVRTKGSDEITWFLRCDLDPRTEKESENQ